MSAIKLIMGLSIVGGSGIILSSYSLLKIPFFFIPISIAYSILMGIIYYKFINNFTKNSLEISGIFFLGILASVPQKTYLTINPHNDFFINSLPLLTFSIAILGVIFLCWKNSYKK